ncbi:MAG: GNAT family N-acetyltransferase [Hyphomicrobium sp.]
MIWTIRTEAEHDEAAIAETIDLAFRGHPHSIGTEAAIVRELRKAGALTGSHVAVVDGAIAGYAATSPVTITPEQGAWLGLGPVAVAPAYQRQGVGAALIETALERLRSAGARGCVVVGNPHTYRRFGFEPSESLTLHGVSPEYFLAKSFGAPPSPGTVCYHAAFAIKP